MAEMGNKITDAKKEEIIKALKVIKGVCKSNTTCKECPFYSNTGYCLITQQNPGIWTIQGMDERWRALL